MTLRTLCTTVALMGCTLTFGQAEAAIPKSLCKLFPQLKNHPDCQSAPAAQPAPAPATQPTPAMNEKQECVNKCFNDRRGQDHESDEDLKKNCELECQSHYSILL